jgi:diaminopimelate decarboxylase
MLCVTSAAERPGIEVGLRFNPGLGSGGTSKTNVGGPASSFGIWHEHAAECLEIATAGKLKVFRIHTHIGSGSDPAVWQKVSTMSLNLVRMFPDVHTLNLGGGCVLALDLQPPLLACACMIAGAPSCHSLRRG